MLYARAQTVSTRGGIVTLQVQDAGGNPVTLDLPEREELALSEMDPPFFAVAHRLNEMRRAACATFTVHQAEARDLALDWKGVLQLCWYCYPRS